jgi:hypothetical protein
LTDHFGVIDDVTRPNRGTTFLYRSRERFLAQDVFPQRSLTCVSGEPLRAA